MISKRTVVRGIVTIPGWWVDDSTQHPVWVLNPKRSQMFVIHPAESPLSSKLVNQIVYKLTERSRLKKAANIQVRAGLPAGQRRLRGGQH